jgi:hypothetical protein
VLLGIAGGYQLVPMTIRLTGKTVLAGHMIAGLLAVVTAYLGTLRPAFPVSALMCLAAMPLVAIPLACCAGLAPWLCGRKHCLRGRRAPWLDPRGVSRAGASHFAGRRHRRGGVVGRGLGGRAVDRGGPTQGRGAAPRSAPGRCITSSAGWWSSALPSCRMPTGSSSHSPTRLPTIFAPRCAGWMASARCCSRTTLAGSTPAAGSTSGGSGRRRSVSLA